MTHEATPVRVRIVVRATARLLSLLKAAMALFALAAAAGLASEASGRLSEDSSDALADVAALIGSGAAGVLAFLVFVSAGAAAIARKAYLEIHPNGLTIHHRGLFRRDIDIAKDNIAAIAFEDRSHRFRRFRDHPRFPLPDPEPASEPRWLYSKVGGAPFPILAQAPEVPNMAICFAQPMVLAPTRRWVKIFPARASIHPPIHKRRSRGLLLRIADTAAAHSALEPWGLTREITQTDLAEVRPSASDRKKVRLLRRLDGAAILTVTLALSVLPLLLQDGAKGSFLVPARGVCKQLDDVRTPPGDDPELPEVAIMQRLLPEDPADKGYVILDATSFSVSDSDDHGFAAVLDRANLENSYYAKWGRPNFDLHAEIYRLPDASQADDLRAALVGLACADASETFTVTGVPDSVGMRWPAEEGIADMTFFARDDYVFWIAVVETGGLDGTDEVIDVSRDVDRGLDALSGRTGA